MHVYLFAKQLVSPTLKYILLNKTCQQPLVNPGSSAVPSAGVGDKGLGCWRWGGGWTHTPSCVQVGHDGVGDDLGDGDVDDGDCLEFYLEQGSSARQCIRQCIRHCIVSLSVAY